jgi:hypothetical protein
MSFRKLLTIEISKKEPFSITSIAMKINSLDIILSSCLSYNKERVARRYRTTPRLCVRIVTPK